MDNGDFTAALSFVLDHEGRVCEDVPGDPGGRTKWGVTQTDYDQYRTHHGEATQSVFEATEAEIDAVYRDHYWTPLHGDDISYPVALTLFDTGVNCGNGRAIRWLQAELGITEDDVFGPNMLQCCHDYIVKHGAATLARGIITRRRAYYNTIGAEGMTLHKFLAGWLARCDDLEEAIAASP